MFVDLNAIPLRDPNLTPAEILMSESQERMMAVVRPDNIEAFERVCAKWDVQATVIGEVTRKWSSLGLPGTGKPIWK